MGFISLFTDGGINRPRILSRRPLSIVTGDKPNARTVQNHNPIIEV